MDFKRTDTFTNNETTMINIPDSLSRIVGLLDHFLEGLHKTRPEIVTEYLQALETKLLSLITKPLPDFKSIQIPRLAEIVSKLTSIQRIYFTYAFQMLEIPSDYASETMEMTWHREDRVRLFSAYYRSLVFCEMIGRKEAIEYLKKYIDALLYERAQPDLSLKDLDTYWETEEEEGSHPSFGLGFRESKGKFGWRVERCVLHDVSKPLDDPELCHILCCYGDTAMFESRNPNFAYTMPKTLMQGDPYCEKCFHDKRHVDKIEHPPKEFWESLPEKAKEQGI